MTRLEENNEVIEMLGELADEVTVSKYATKDDMPCAGDIYHMITSKGTIAIYEWSDCAFDKHCYEIGNCFMSIEDTEFALEKLKVIHELKQFAESKEKAWDSEDAISRADIIEEIEKLRMSSGVTNQSTWNECVDVILSTIKNKDWFPSVQPTLIKASDIQPDDEWMQENDWDEIYKKESEGKE